MAPFAEDADPSAIGKGLVGAVDGPTRITAPMVRKGWLEGRSGRRGSDRFVEVSWAVAEQLVADELARVKAEQGNQGIFAGCYGWASAGRFHHAQSQIHRFMNCIGGYVKSVNTYSFAAAKSSSRMCWAIFAALFMIRPAGSPFVMKAHCLSVLAVCP